MAKNTERPLARLPNPNIWKDFKDFVIDKYGTDYAVTGIELEKAIKYHLAMEGWKDYSDMVDEGVLIENPSAHTHKVSNADKILIHKIYNNISPGTEVNFNVLCKWMRRDCGLKDKRTHKAHIDTLVDLGVLVNNGDNDHPYHLYEVVEPNSDSFLYKMRKNILEGENVEQ